MHPLVVIFGVLIGEELYGFIGIILAVPVVVILKETAVYLSERMGWFGLATAGAPTATAGAADAAPDEGDTLTGFRPPPPRRAPAGTPPAADDGDTMDVTAVVEPQPIRPTRAD